MTKFSKVQRGSSEAESSHGFSVTPSPLTPGTGGGDWLIAAGDVSGRKLTLLAQSGSNGTANGAVDCLALSDGTTLLGVIDGDGETINAGSPWTTSAVDVLEIRAAVNE